MSIETKILSAAAKSRSAYEAVIASGEAGGFSPLHLPLWDAIGAYYVTDSDAKSVDRDVVIENVARRGDGDKKAGALRRLAGEILDIEVSPSNITALLRDQARDTAGLKLAAAIAGRKPPSEIDALARGFIALLDEPSRGDEDESLTWDTVLESVLDPANKLKISPPCLNTRLKGGVPPGTMIGVFMRPNLGKSSLALTMACGFMRRRVPGLYLGNEDPIATLMKRAAANLTGLTVEEMEADPTNARRLAIEKGVGFGTFRQIAPGTPAEVERLVKRYKPKWLVVDQLRNLRVRGTESKTAALDEAGQELRAITIKYGLVTIGVMQAGDSASGRLVLRDSDIDQSKTGLPGAFDVLIGGGANDEFKAIGQRMLTLIKNKVAGIEESWPVTLDPFHSKYVSIK